MRNLIIKNIGPIKTVNIELDKLNIFIGPQSKGKSTITKIACYCSWVEKRVALLKSNQEQLSEKDAFAKELVRFHKLTGYLQEDSYIYYKSDILTIEYLHSNRKPIFEWKNRFDYKKGKISYIPSERNIVAAIPNWLNIKFIDNNIRSFIADWDEARNICPKENPLSILNIGAKYFFDGESDKVIINPENKQLELTNTSSGLQSLIPLLVLLDYIYKGIYQNENPASIKDLKDRNVINMDLMQEVMGTSSLTQILDLAEKRNNIVHNGNSDITGILEKFKRLEILNNNFTGIHHTTTYLEEPEQNLFPTAQRDLVGELIRLNNLNDDHSLTITTHSPYILSSINNLIYAHNVGQSHQDEVATIVPTQNWISYEKVRVYFVDNGKATSILDEEIKQIKAETIDEVSSILNQEYDQLMDIDN
ncbi:ATP-binding protein [Bacteroides sp. 519]|uniref:AAA family ATPase n=1 Tax=Bacteroides sp. 519 TaxID=2302937 RepID=UPI0013D5E1AA|nr:ATP-binding protein [Bacteroides sp. 519]NDV58091.1 ATP-binding protein [Bacteroides sp. 519]